MNTQVFLHCRKIVAGVMAFVFAISSIGPGYAQSVGTLPMPGFMASLSQPFKPSMLKGIRVDPQNPLHFEFIMDKGDFEKGEEPSLQDESKRLVKYFLASLTVPEKDLWVNLSPYEKDRIVPEAFGRTEMGRDLLAQDYLLKQITASLMYPEGETGKKFWARVYEAAYQKYGTTDIPVDTFNKVWITPEKAIVYENGPLTGSTSSPQRGSGQGRAGTAYIIETRLKVMLETDYLAQNAGEVSPSGTLLEPPLRNEAGSVGAIQESPLQRDIVKNVMRSIIIPLLEKEVNEGENFAPLRQVYHSLILAVWYKKKIVEAIHESPPYGARGLQQVYVDRNKVSGVNIDDPREKEKIYQRYLEAFRKGVFNYIKEEVDPSTLESIPRKYFSGGLGFEAANMDKAFRLTEDRAQVRRSLPGSGVLLLNVMLDMAQDVPQDPATPENGVVFQTEDGRAFVVSPREGSSNEVDVKSQRTKAWGDVPVSGVVLRTVEKADVPRVKREAAILQKLELVPGLERVVSSDLGSDRPWVAVKTLSDAKPLSEYLFQIYSMSNILELFQKIVSQLEDIHQAKEVHGNINGATVWVNKRDAQIRGFGKAGLATEEKDVADLVALFKSTLNQHIAFLLSQDPGNARWYLSNAREVLEGVNALQAPSLGQIRSWIAANQVQSLIRRLGHAIPGEYLEVGASPAGGAVYKRVDKDAQKGEFLKWGAGYSEVRALLKLGEKGVHGVPTALLFDAESSRYFPDKRYEASFRYGGASHFLMAAEDGGEFARFIMLDDAHSLDHHVFRSVEEIIRTMIRAGVQLEDIHRVLVHKDMKPANILINQEGVVQIIDYEDVDEHGDTRGTEFFVAPTPDLRLESPKRADSDVYGFIMSLVSLVDHARAVPFDVRKRLIEKYIRLLFDQKVPGGDFVNWEYMQAGFMSIEQYFQYIGLNQDLVRKPDLSHVPNGFQLIPKDRQERPSLQEVIALMNQDMAMSVDAARAKYEGRLGVEIKISGVAPGEKEKFIAEITALRSLDRVSGVPKVLVSDMGSKQPWAVIKSLPDAEPVRDMLEKRKRSGDFMRLNDFLWLLQKAGRQLKWIQASGFQPNNITLANLKAGRQDVLWEGLGTTDAEKDRAYYPSQLEGSGKEGVFAYIMTILQGLDLYRSVTYSRVGSSSKGYYDVMNMIFNVFLGLIFEEFKSGVEKIDVSDFEDSDIMQFLLQRYGWGSGAALLTLVSPGKMPTIDKVIKALGHERTESIQYYHGGYGVFEEVGNKERKVFRIYDKPGWFIKKLTRGSMYSFTYPELQTLLELKAKGITGIPLPLMTTWDGTSTSDYEGDYSFLDEDRTGYAAFKMLEDAESLNDYFFDDARDILKTFLDIGRKLDEIYQKTGVVHLDLKPRNFLRSNTNADVQVIDWEEAAKVGKDGFVAGNKGRGSPFFNALTPEFKVEVKKGRDSEVYSLIMSLVWVIDRARFIPGDAREKLIEKYLNMLFVKPDGGKLVDWQYITEQGLSLEEYFAEIGLNFATEEARALVRVDERRALVPKPREERPAFEAVLESLQEDRGQAVDPKGGIDLASGNVVEIRDNASGITFNMDPKMLEQLQNAPGFVPRIVNVQPMTDLPAFLGLNN